MKQEVKGLKVKVPTPSHNREVGNNRARKWGNRDGESMPSGERLRVLGGVLGKVVGRIITTMIEEGEMWKQALPKAWKW